MVLKVWPRFKYTDFATERKSKVGKQIKDYFKSNYNSIWYELLQGFISFRKQEK